MEVFADKLSGKTAYRPEPAACLDYLRAGDTLVVPSLDRLSRSLQDLITIVAGLRRSGTGPVPARGARHRGGRLVFHVLASDEAHTPGNLGCGCGQQREREPAEHASQLPPLITL